VDVLLQLLSTALLENTAAKENASQLFLLDLPAQLITNAPEMLVLILHLKLNAPLEHAKNLDLLLLMMLVLPLLIAKDLTVKFFAPTGSVLEENQGDGCSSSNSCNFGLFCNFTSLKCEAVRGQGAACTDDDECQIPLACKSGTCGAVFTSALGAACEPGSFLDCVPGTFCAQNGVCAQPSANNLCTNSTQCSGGAECACNLVTGFARCNTLYLPAGCDKVYKKLGTCANDNECVNSFSFHAGSCAFTNCESEVRAAYDCFTAASGLNLYPSCLFNAAPSTSVSFILLAALSFLAYFL